MFIYWRTLCQMPLSVLTETNASLLKDSLLLWYYVESLPRRRESSASSLRKPEHSHDNLDYLRFLPVYIYIYIYIYIITGRSRLPCGLRRGPAAACLLVLWVRISPGNGCLSIVSIVCCQVEVSASDWSSVQRSPTACGVSECDRQVL